MGYRRIVLVTALVFVGTFFGIVHDRAWAYPPCGPFQEPLTDAHGSFCRPEFPIGGELLRLTPGVPYAWLRSAPSSTAPAIRTLYPVAYANLQTDLNTPATNYFWDGYQNWYRVHPYPLDKDVIGWVEQASLEYAPITGYPPEDPTTQADWSVPVNGHVKPGIPFLWMRSQPDSSAATLFTIPVNGAITIAGSPAFDGVQWWWRVDYASPQGVKQGYVEQQLIIAR